MHIAQIQGNKFVAGSNLCEIAARNNCGGFINNAHCCMNGFPHLVHKTLE